MKICVNCKTEMTCIKTGYKVVFGEAHCYSADLYLCVKCGSRIAVCASEATYQPGILGELTEKTGINIVG